MIKQFRAQLESFESPETSGSLGELGFAGNDNDNVDRFNADDVDYFDSFYENKSANIAFVIEHFDKNIFFRNIYIFLDRVKNIVRIKNNVLLR